VISIIVLILKENFLIKSVGFLYSRTLINPWATLPGIVYRAHRSFFLRVVLHRTLQKEKILTSIFFFGAKKDLEDLSAYAGGVAE
jgi:hypothetical protein